MRLDKLTSRFQQALADAQSLAVGRDHNLLEPSHVLVALIDQAQGSTRPLLGKAGVNLPALRSALGERLDRLQSVKGYAGTIKRYNFASGRASHGNSRSHNVPGSIGMAQDPGRVFPGKRMTGHLGDVQKTVQNLEIVRVDVARQLLLVKGAVPGAQGGNIIVRPAVKAGA